MSRTIRRVIVPAPDRIEVQDAQAPVPAAGEALVSLRTAGVCGSDLHAVAGHHPWVPLPYAPGHEVVGIVEEAPGDAQLRPGDRVIVEPTLPCWDCKPCRRGDQNLCERLRFFGCGYEQGGMADLFTVPVNRLHRIDERLSDAEGLMIEPLATPVHAVRLAASGLTGEAARNHGGDLRGKRVVVLGAGTIGLLVLIAARHLGAEGVVVTDLSASKRERALRLGAAAALDAGRDDIAAAVRGELGESADIVFDCVAATPTLGLAVELAQRGGTVVIVGVPSEGTALPLPIVQDRQVRVQGAATYLPADYQEAAGIIAAGGVPEDEFISGTFPLAQAAEAFAAARERETVKVLITG